MPISVDNEGNVLHLPYSPQQGNVPTSYNKLEGTDVARDSGIKAQERALVELALRRMENGNGTSGFGGGIS